MCHAFSCTYVIDVHFLCLQECCVHHGVALREKLVSCWSLKLRCWGLCRHNAWGKGCCGSVGRLQLAQAPLVGATRSCAAGGVHAEASPASLVVAAAWRRRRAATALRSRDLQPQSIRGHVAFLDGCDVRCTVAGCSKFVACKYVHMYTAQQTHRLARLWMDAWMDRCMDR